MARGSLLEPAPDAASIAVCHSGDIALLGIHCDLSHCLRLPVVYALLLSSLRPWLDFDDLLHPSLHDVFSKRFDS